MAANAATIKVANMSLGGSGYSQAEYDAIQGAVNKGVAFAVAAGNEDDDANNYSPSAFDNVLSSAPWPISMACRAEAPPRPAAPTRMTPWPISATGGRQVDIAAPGVCILSTYPIEKGEYGTISGTSMASPHAAGALALLASRNKPTNATDVYNLYNQVKNAGNYNWTDDSGDGIKEPLLDVSTFAADLDCRGRAQITHPLSPSPARPMALLSSRAQAISFAARLSDNEDGNLTGSLVWTSNMDGSNRHRWLLQHGTQRWHAHHHRLRDRFRRLNRQRQHHHHCCCTAAGLP